MTTGDSVAMDRSQACQAQASSVDVVVGGVLVREGRALMVHRCPQRRWYPDVWDVPGGHVEAGADHRAALRRELREELGVEAEIARDIERGKSAGRGF